MNATIRSRRSLQRGALLVFSFCLVFFLYQADFQTLTFTNETELRESPTHLKAPAFAVNSTLVPEIPIKEEVGELENITSSMLMLKNTTNPAPPLQKLELAPEHNICLVHVGKAGGSTVMCAVGLNASKCRPNSTIWNSFTEFRDRSAIAAHVHDRVHLGPDHHQCHSPIKAFVATIRHPIDRFYSWFNRGVPYVVLEGHYLWEDCYSTMTDFVVALETVPPSINTGYLPNMTCPERAWAITLGARLINDHGHNWYNFEYYLDNMESMAAGENLPLLVLRNEHVASDWNRVEEMLGGTSTDGEAMFATKVNAQVSNSTSSNITATSKAMAELGPERMRYLCRALCTEIQHYKTFLQVAVNLTPQQKAESMVELRDLCPVEADTDACPDVPKIALAQPDDQFVGAGKPRFKLLS